MAYKQKNNPFAVTSCGRRRNYMTVGNSSPVKIVGGFEDHKKNAESKNPDTAYVMGSYTHHVKHNHPHDKNTPVKKDKKLSKEVIQNYKDINIGKDVLDYLEVTPSDTVTVIPVGHRGINPRNMAARSLAGKDGDVKLPKASGYLNTSGEQGSKKETIAHGRAMSDQTYYKDDKEKLASAVQKRKRKRKPDVRKTTKGKNRNFRTTKEGAGMTKKGVAAYRRKNPGSKLKTAVTGKVKKGSKAAKRRKSFCARSRGWKGPRGRAARRRWRC